MAVLLNRVHPNLRILNPATGGYAAFAGGKLVIEDDDPNYEVVMTQANRDPDIIVTTKVTQCPECGEEFTGKLASMDLGRHRSAIHPIEFDRDREAKAATQRNAIVKRREGFCCDVCAPLQCFGTADDLTLHTRLMHGAPFVDPDGKGVPDEVRDLLGGENTRAET